MYTMLLSINVLFLIKAYEVLALLHVPLVSCLPLFCSVAAPPQCREIARPAIDATTTMQGARLLLLALLPCAVALTCRPQIRMAQPMCVRASPPAMISEADPAKLLRLEQEIQRLQLQAETLRPQAQVSSAAEAVTGALPPDVTAAVAPVPMAAVERIANAVLDATSGPLTFPSSIPVDEAASASAAVSAVASAAVGAGAQQLTTTSIPLDKAYPVAKAVTGEALFIGRMDSPASLAGSVLRQRI